MNIFILDTNPHFAAIYQCDKHVIKMVLESAQLLCSQFNNGIAPYRRTHYNHPCSRWSRTSRANYLWLLNHAESLANEYTFRYGRRHKSHDVIQWCSDNVNLLSFPKSSLTNFYCAMPDDCKVDNVVKSYRLYYKKHKYSFAKWEKHRKAPYWWGYNA